MFERRPAQSADVFEHQPVTQPGIATDIAQPLTIDPTARRQTAPPTVATTRLNARETRRTLRARRSPLRREQGVIVDGARHLCRNCGILVRQCPDAPARRVGRGRRITPGQHLGRREFLKARAEGAERRLAFKRRSGEVHRSARTSLRHRYPPASKRTTPPLRLGQGVVRSATARHGHA